jgi:hypothetical protein
VFPSRPRVILGIARNTFEHKLSLLQDANVQDHGWSLPKAVVALFFVQNPRFQFDLTDPCHARIR